MDGIILFDDGRGEFGPMTDMRASFDLRTGALCTAERLERRLGVPIVARIPQPQLAPLVAEAYPDTSAENVDESGRWLIVNGRFPDAAEAPPLSDGHMEIDGNEGVLRRAMVSGKVVNEWRGSGEDLPKAESKTVDAPALLRYPWDILTSAPGRIEGDLKLLAAQGTSSEAPYGEGVTVLGDADVLVLGGAELDPGVVLDARHGAIIIGPGCHIGSGAVLVGPMAIGESCNVAPNTHLKSGTIAGPSCKLGGEIGASIFHGHTNKSHHGHIGDSLIGEWANLGAGTVNSNLLNTYSEVLVRLDPDGQTIRSGRTYLGCVIGDHVKTAIGTRIMTGCVLGTGSMIASSTPPPLSTPRFSWVTDRDTHRYRFQKFIEVVQVVMTRRGIEPGAHYLDRLREMHEAMG